MTLAVWLEEFICYATFQIPFERFSLSLLFILVFGAQRNIHGTESYALAD